MTQTLEKSRNLELECTENYYVAERTVVISGERITDYTLHKRDGSQTRAYARIYWGLEELDDSPRIAISTASANTPEEIRAIAEIMQITADKVD